jgi:hypothetical protein
MRSTQTPPVRNPNFIHSSFSTPYRKSGTKSRTTGSESRRQRKYDDFSDEDKAMSSTESDSDAEVLPVSEEAPSTRSSKRRRIANPKYNTEDVHTSTDDEEEQQQPSDESDGGYNPVVEYEQEKAKREKRGRANKAGRRGEEHAEEA